MEFKIHGKCRTYYLPRQTEEPKTYLCLLLALIRIQSSKLLYVGDNQDFIAPPPKIALAVCCINHCLKAQQNFSKVLVLLAKMVVEHCERDVLVTKPRFD